MTTLERMPFEKLHEMVYRLSERQRAGGHSCDELLGKLLDALDERAAREDEETEDLLEGRDDD